MEAGRGDGKVSSATDVNVNDAQALNGKVATKKRRSNPVVLEVQVSVAGARPASSRDSRELFTEETHTVLVFKDGAVIQLSAAVAVGQLLFLTEKKTKREVVCQVVHKRSHRPTTCYVELEFTEDPGDYWGVSFPTDESAAKDPATAEAVEAEETTEDDSSEPEVARKSDDLGKLKSEVEELRAELDQLRAKKAAEEKDAQSQKLAEAELAARAAAEAEAKQKAEAETKRKAERAEAERAESEAAQRAAQEPPQPNTEIAAKKPEETPTAVEEPAPPAPPPVLTAPPRIGMKLPTAGLPQVWNESWAATAAAAEAHEGLENDPLEDLLPKPALDFSKNKKVLDPNDPHGIYRLSQKKAGGLEYGIAAGVLVLVLSLGVVAWYRNWLPFLHRIPAAPSAKASLANENPAGSAESTTNSGAAAGHPTSAAPAGVNSGTDLTARPVATTNGTSGTPSAVPGKTDAIFAPETASPAERAALAEAPGKGGAGSGKGAPGKTAATKSGKNRGKAQTSGESAPAPVAPEVVAADAPIVPAKLLRAAQPVYPPDAMRNYITGDVRIEAEVDKEGHIGAMRVLLGPSQFRQAAMAALTQYEYAPATRGGKPVASKVTVTIKFWFDP
jgi:TonB family protein